MHKCHHLTQWCYLRTLYEELRLRDQMFQEFREQKEREIAELTAIKGDLEVRLQRVSEEGELGDLHLLGELLSESTHTWVDI